MAIWQGGSGAREAGRAGGGQATRSDVPPSPFHRGSRGDHDEGLPTAEKSFRDRFPRRVEGALWPSRGRIAAGRGGARAHQCRVVVGEPPTPSTPPDARQRDGATAVSLDATSKSEGKASTGTRTSLCKTSLCGTRASFCKTSLCKSCTGTRTSGFTSRHRSPLVKPLPAIYAIRRRSRQV